MRQYVLTLALVFTTILSVSAQSPDFGLRAGLNYNDYISSDDPTPYDPVVTPTGGIFVRFIVSDRLSIEPNILYSQKGYTYEYYGPIDDQLSGEATFHNLDIPVWIRYNIIGGLNLFAGPEISFNLFTDGYSQIGPVLLAEVERSNDIVAGVSGGVGYRFPAGVDVQAAYGRSVSDVRDIAGSNHFTNLQLTVGYAF